MVKHLVKEEHAYLYFCLWFVVSDTQVLPIHHGL